MKNRYEKMENTMKRINAEAELEKQNEWMKWIHEIPFINIPSDYCIQVAPPFSGAVIRFRVAHNKNTEDSVSVYLDCYNRLGFYTDSNNDITPYWEIYPHIDGDVFRCGIEETELLMQEIIESVDRLNINE